MSRLDICQDGFHVIAGSSAVDLPSRASQFSIQSIARQVKVCKIEQVVDAGAGSQDDVLPYLVRLYDPEILRSRARSQARF